MAEEAAKNMVQKKRAALKEDQESYKVFVKDMYMTTVPDEVKKLFQTHRSYMEVGGCINVYDNGMCLDQIYYGSQNGFPSKEGYRASYQADVHVIGICRDLKRREDELDNLESSIFNALYGLKTRKAVESAFPEALEFLQETEVRAIAVNIGPIRELLNQEP